MKYIKTSEIASKWGISDRMVRKYIAQGLIDNVKKQGKTWYISSDTIKPIRKKLNTNNLVKILLNEKKQKKKDGIYHYSQVVFAYNSNKIEGSKLTADQTQEIYETNSFITKTNDLVKLDDVIETRNHFRLFDYMLENYNKPLNKKMIIKMNVILKTGTSDELNSKYNVGGFKINENEIGNFVNPIKTTKPKNVEKDLDELLDKYLNKEKININDIIDFHYQFERIHPFSDGNGRVGRIIMYKECLKNNITPFIITNNNRTYYMRGLKEYKNEKGYLVDTILHEQDTYKKVINKLI